MKRSGSVAFYDIYVQILWYLDLLCNEMRFYQNKVHIFISIFDDIY